MFCTYHLVVIAEYVIKANIKIAAVCAALIIIHFDDFVTFTVCSDISGNANVTLSFLDFADLIFLTF